MTKDEYDSQPACDCDGPHESWCHWNRTPNGIPLDVELLGDEAEHLLRFGWDGPTHSESDEEFLSRTKRLLRKLSEYAR